MGIKNMIAKAGTRAADKVAKLAVLSPDQLQEVQEKREAYLSEAPSVDDENAVELTSRLLAASSIEVFNEYLNHLQDMYIPVKREAEYGTSFNVNHNIRYFEITKWVTNKKENSLEKLVNVYEVLSNEECNIALIFHRTCNKTQVFLAVTNTANADSNKTVDNYKTRLVEAIKGNFPGSELCHTDAVGTPKCLEGRPNGSVACATNIPGEKSQKFLTQTIEKLLDGIVPDSVEKEYTVILLATPIKDVENRKIHLAELYSGLAPYAGWDTNYTFTASDAVSAGATFGVNVGASAGIQQGQTSANTSSHGGTENISTTNTDSTSQGETTTEGSTVTDTTGETNTSSSSESTGHTEGTSSSTGESVRSDAVANDSAGSVAKNIWKNLSEGITGTTKTNTTTIGSNVSDTVNKTVSESIAKNVSQSIASSTSKAMSNTVAQSVANTLGKAVSNTVSKTAGIYKGVNLGANIGANFARTSNITATVGKNEGITQHFTNYNIKHLLENLELQMKRYEQSTALGMWDFAAYVMSEDQNVANNVAYSYIALTQGEKSYVSNTAVNLWRGDMGDNSDDAKEICAYLQELRHPIFALNPELSDQVPISNVYPPVVTATTSLSGKELAYSLNFPQHSIAGLPVFNCTEFGRDIVSYDIQKNNDRQLAIGKVFHMNQMEKADVNLLTNSLASHVFVTGSTGSGKSNTVYKIIDEAVKQDIKFLVIEPAKGEYKNVFGNRDDVAVYGTNPNLSELLRINPFSFPKNIHIYEHMDRLIEIFNVCWPMYAAMPAVLKNAVEKAYEDCGWDLVQSTNIYGADKYPVFADVARNIKTIIDSSEYDNENKGAYKGSLLTRLQSLANGINGQVFCNNELAPELLFERNVIIDLSRVGSSETKSLIMGMLVLKLQEFRMSSSSGMNNHLKHITILEEAHNILKRTSTEQPVEGGNLIGKSVEMISNAIAEMRTYGEGFVIVDQAPGLMDMSAIRNTNTKIIMRLPDQTDRELVGKAANLNEDQINELAKLPCGVGAIYQNEWVQPVLCKVDLVEDGFNVYEYFPTSSQCLTYDDKTRFYIAELLSNGAKLGKDVSREVIMNQLEGLPLTDFEKISIIRLLDNPPREPNMTKLAPVMNALFPDVTKTIKQAHANETDESEWTREANDILIRQKIDDQVRRDIVQASITYYMLNETNNREALERWIIRGGLI